MKRRSRSTERSDPVAPPPPSCHFFLSILPDPLRPAHPAQPRRAAQNNSDSRTLPRSAKVNINTMSIKYCSVLSVGSIQPVDRFTCLPARSYGGKKALPPFLQLILQRLSPTHNGASLMGLRRLSASPLFSDQSLKPHQHVLHLRGDRLLPPFAVLAGKLVQVLFYVPLRRLHR